MKFRAVANGNIVEDVHEGLVTAGIYEPVEEPKQAAPKKAEPPKESAPKKEDAPKDEPKKESASEDKDTSVEPIGTKDMPTKAKRTSGDKK